MKEKIHPEYYEATVTCACGNKFKTGSTKKQMTVDICANCHPFFTGTQKIMDAEGRIQKFERRYAKKAEAPAAKPATKTAAKTEKATEKSTAKKPAAKKAAK